MRVLGVVDVVELRVVALLVVLGVMLFNELAVVDDAAPRAGLDLLHLDEGHEPGQVSPHGPLDMAHSTCRLLEQRARVDIESDLNARQAIRELVERDDAGMGHALAHGPHDPLVRTLLDDLRLELLRHAPDLGPEGDVAVVLLRRLIEAVHELRPFLELRPLVVGGRERHSNVNCLLHGHPPTLADAGRALLALAASASASGEDSLSGLLRDPGSAARLIDLLADGVLDTLADRVIDPFGQLVLHACRVARRLFGRREPLRHGALYDLARSSRDERGCRGQGSPRGHSAGARERPLPIPHRRAPVSRNALDRLSRDVAERIADRLAEVLEFRGHLSSLMYPLSLLFRSTRPGPHL